MAQKSPILGQYDNAIEALIADDFHFTSPLDNRIDRATYFVRCWPNSATLAGFDFIHIVPDGDLVFVTYEGRSTSGRRFRNSEILTVHDGKISSYRQFLVTACRIRRQLLGFDGHQALR